MMDENFEAWLLEGMRDGSIIIEDILHMPVARNTKKRASHGSRIRALLKLWAEDKCWDMEDYLYTMVLKVAREEARE